MDWWSSRQRLAHIYRMYHASFFFLTERFFRTAVCQRETLTICRVQGQSMGGLWDGRRIGDAVVVRVDHSDHYAINSQDWIPLHLGAEAGIPLTASCMLRRGRISDLSKELETGARREPTIRIYSSRGSGGHSTHHCTPAVPPVVPPSSCRSLNSTARVCRWRLGFLGKCERDVKMAAPEFPVILSNPRCTVNKPPRTGPGPSPS
jgi:hypothetical protein